MRFATWNVNSLKARLPRVEEWLQYANPTCCASRRRSSPTRPFRSSRSALGYESVHHGPGQWNGVATLSRVGIENVSSGFGEGVLDPYEGDARLLAATCGGIRFVNVYVPNGREVGSDHYERKLQWFTCLLDWLGERHAERPTRRARRLQRRPRGPRRVVTEGVQGSDARDGRRARRRRGAARLGPRRRSVPSTTTTSCSRTGTIAAATSTSTGGCASTSRS